ncbi:MAG: hypothetical protein O2816_13465, partial [Planctomycetota bacterium]|nr:hypothetical protein [Planctomycetota bacterium]
MSTTLNLALAVALSLAAQDPPAAEQEAAPPARTHYALVGATVHSMVPGEEPAVRTVVVNEGRIEAVLAQDVELPEGLERLDLGGLHLTPGLIDGHVNHDLEHDSLYVSRGVTLVRDTGNHVHNVLQFRLPEIRDLAPGPDLYICGPALTGLDQASTTVWGLPNPRAASEVLPRKLDELEAQAVAMGLSPDAFRFDYLMFRNDLTKETAAALVRMAHGRGIEVWGYMPVG